MRPGRYAADDGSFARSAGGAGARGLALLAVALLIGVVLLNATDADPPGTTLTSSGDRDAAGGDNGDGDGDAATPESTTIAPPPTTLPARAPKDVKVVVANGTEVKGAATGGRNALLPAGFNVLAPIDGPAAEQSTVFFTVGYDRDAAAIAAALELPAAAVKPMPSPAPFDIKGANVAVVLGNDHAARFGASSESTTTTAAAAAATTTAKP